MSGRASGGRRTPLLLAVVAALTSVVVVPSPARAEITAISPAVREVNPGETTTATVTINYPGTTCVSGSGSVDSTFAPVCGDNEWRSTMTVRAPNEPGTYVVNVTHDKTNTSRRFELRVRAPAPPTTTTAPPPPTTTTTRPPTTTTLPPTTTTTAAPVEETTTTLAPETTTTMAPPPPGGGFVTVASLIEQGVPDEGIFLPLLSAGYQRCLPLSRPCVVDDSGLVLVPARTTELAWPTLLDDAVVSPRLDLRGVAPLQPVGQPPADPGAQDYSLPFLDLAAQGGQLRTLVRGLDGEGRLVTPRSGGTLAAPRAEGPMATPEVDTFLASAPFGRPELRNRDDFTEAAPAIALFSSTELQVVYAIRPVPTWGLDTELLPLLGAEGVPYLVRGVDGPPGLYVARPEGLTVPSVETEETDAVETDAGGGGGGLPAVALLAGAVGAGAFLTGALAWRRRRGATDDQ